MKIITYFLYGNNPKYNIELSFSIFSMLRFLRHSSQDIIISIISDRHDFQLNFPGIKIEHTYISHDELNYWTKQGQYHHRAKIFALAKALDYYQLPVVLIDTDTYFIQHPQKLFERISVNKSIMHNFEYRIDNSKLWEPIVRELGEGIEVSGTRISPESLMFNSGVIGVDISHRELLDKSINVLDTLQGISPIFNVEQFALGVVFNQFTNLDLCTDIVKHYWGYERGFIHIQADRLMETLQKNNYSVINFDQDKMGYPPKNFQDSLESRILSIIKKWDKNYAFAYLAYLTAFRYVSQDMAYANEWANVTLQVIKFALMDYQSDKEHPNYFKSLERDFYLLNQNNIHSLHWLDESVKSNWLKFWQVWQHKPLTI
ncbi:hypothetical protein [Calothrix sp. 336/3]|uniref:hypothetical protein n=1 Tax=Calothrix sp. 336/3 TaxID=1337936 RepID=UPI0005504D50|nr:hypothetical protein [Calothrix sp. 336/3]AKG22770.1 hypothetical protein IJ00_17155 [Calothrix sp. 336/3]